VRTAGNGVSAAGVVTRHGPSDINKIQGSRSSPQLLSRLLKTTTTFAGIWIVRDVVVNMS